MDAFCMCFYPILSYPIYTCIYMIHSTEYQTFDRFFWVLSAARVRKMISIWCGNQAPKKRTNIYIHPMIHTLSIPHSIHAVGRPWSRLLQPPMGVVEDAQPPSRQGTEEA